MTPDGFAFLKRAMVLAGFVPDFSEEKAKFLADAQVATVSEIDGGHLAFVSQPEVAAAFIRTAAEAVAG